ncbi:MAG: HU family DNA-binding protein [Akkermansia sp.]|nr:HU family DNA-binding protein [Akkermansia sp.]MBR3943621.1 HU family DNA-binding protein [Akkermansia sp.]
MTHTELLEAIRLALGGTATQSAAELALHAVTRAIRDGLAEDDCVKLAGFGTFRCKTVAERRLRLPHNGKSLQLPRRRVLRFTPTNKNIFLR